MIHEVKRYDGDGNLIGVVSTKECRKDFWRQLNIDAETGEQNGSSKPLRRYEPDEKNRMILGPYTANQKKYECTCIECGAKFLGKFEQKYCSDVVGREVKFNCRNIAYRRKALKQRVKKIISKPCALCGKIFNAKYDNREKYCHNPCSWQVANYGESVTHKYNCMVCDKEFESTKTRAWAKYCHNPCTPKTMASIKRKENALNAKNVGRPCK